MNELYHENDDRIRDEREKKAIIKKQVLYEFDKKAFSDSLSFASEKRLLYSRNQQQKKLTNWTLIGLLSMIFLSFILFRSYKIIKAQKETISISLSEKDTLLKEIHHRVKNNLQVISSLLNLQTKSTDDEIAKSALKEGQSRVHSMSLIHQNLYKKDNLIGIEMNDYLKSLCRNLFDTYNINSDRILLILEIDDLNLDVDTVVPLGLIINELITNSLKYAFPDEHSGEISISLKKDSGMLILKVRDTGIGLNPMEVKAGNSFGYSLINAFVKKLKAEMSLISENGTTVIISLKEI